VLLIPFVPLSIEYIKPMMIIAILSPDSGMPANPFEIVHYFFQMPCLGIFLFASLTCISHTKIYQKHYQFDF